MEKVIKNLNFVIHKHEAYRAGLHYDLRLQIPKEHKLWSFACRYVPGSKEKQLIIKQPDHDWYWLTFSGSIPKGEYGGGTLTIYDKGKYDILSQNNTTKVFFFKGDKLKGKYALVKLSLKNNYLFVRMKNQEENE